MKTLLIEHDHASLPAGASTADSGPSPLQGDHKEQRATDRRPIDACVEAHGAQVFVERCDGSQSKAFCGQLQAITPGDLRIGISTPLPLDNASSLRIRMQPFHFDLAVWADLCSCRAAEGIRWELACTLDPPLPREALRMMDTEDKPPPRPMKSCTLRATARGDVPELSWPVRVEAIGQAGLQIAVAHSVKAGTRLELEFEPPDGSIVTIAVRTAWQLRTAEHFVLGALFEDDQGRAHAREFVEQMGHDVQRSARRPPLRPRIGLPRGVAIVALMAAVAAPLGLYATATRKWSILSVVSALGISVPPDVAATRKSSPTTTEEVPHDRKRMPHNEVLGPVRIASTVVDRHSPAVSGSPAPERHSAVQRPQVEPTDIGILRRKLHDARQAWQAERQRQQAELAEQSRELRKQAEELIELRTTLRREQEAARIEADHRRLRAEQVARRDQQRTKPAAKRDSHPATRAYRIWSAAEGDFQLEATFVSIDRGIVRLQRPDGRQATVALDQLAPADQQRVRSLIAGAAHTSPGSTLQTR